jgi:hypothetical protein
VARVEYEGNGIGALLRHLGCEVSDLGPQFGLRQIGGGQHLKAGIGQHLRYGFGVVGRIGKRHHRAIVRLADDERNAILGKGRV